MSAPKRSTVRRRIHRKIERRRLRRLMNFLRTTAVDMNAPDDPIPMFNNVYRAPELVIPDWAMKVNE